MCSELTDYLPNIVACSVRAYDFTSFYWWLCMHIDYSDLGYNNLILINTLFCKGFSSYKIDMGTEIKGLCINTYCFI